MVKLFNLELKNDDPMDLASEIKSIMHDIDATRVKIDLPLTTFIKALYPTYSHYLESLQASGQMKSITFDKLVEKVAEHEKSFGKKSSHSTGETMCLAQKEKSQPHDSSRGEGKQKRTWKKYFQRQGGRHNQGDRSNLHCTHCKNNGSHEANDCRVPWEKIKEDIHNKKRTKVKLQNQQKVNHLNLLITLFPIAI
jgi:hypothetical protein